MQKPKSDSIMNTEGWGQINWRKAERYVFRLQKRIYAASRRGDVKQCRKLQRTLRRSWFNRALAVRRVTVENQGKCDSQWTNHGNQPVNNSTNPAADYCHKG